MTPEQIELAAAILWKATTGTHPLASLPESAIPRTRADGYAVQQALARLSGQQGYGWKIASSSSAGQRHLNVDAPLAGRLFINRVLPTTRPISLNANRMKVGEAEFAFRMAKDLPPRGEPYGVGDVMASVGALYPAIELPDSRFIDYTKVGAPSLIADNACAHEFVLGDEVKIDWRSLDLSKHCVMVTRNGESNCQGLGSNVLGDPRIALTWLANELNTYGLMLRASETITTGTCVVPFALAAGDRFSTDFGALGSVTISLTD
ncbi:MAG: hydratase [Burkholderiales bacterium]